MNIEWTHKELQITDIRKVRKFYVISVDDKKINNPLFVDHSIFEGRVNSYYLRGFKNSYDIKNYSSVHNEPEEIKREEVINVKWNMAIYKGFFIKYNANNEAEKIYKDQDKFYISFLEIAGPLGSHISN